MILFAKKLTSTKMSSSHVYVCFNTHLIKEACFGCRVAELTKGREFKSKMIYETIITCEYYLGDKILVIFFTLERIVHEQTWENQTQLFVM